MQAAASERVERLDDLVAGAERVGERVEPDVDAIADVREEVRHQRRAREEQDRPDDDEADPTGRGVDEGQEHGEEEQRGTEVTLDHDDQQRDRPHRDHRREVRQRRQPDRTDAGVLLDQEWPVLGQVAGKEHHRGSPSAARTAGRRTVRSAGSGADRRRPVPNTNVSSSSAIPAAAHVYLYRRSQLSERTTMPRVVATMIARTSQISCTSPSPSVEPATSIVTRSCGSRCISSREIPPSSPTTGRSTSSERRPASTCATWAPRKRQRGRSTRHGRARTRARRPVSPAPSEMLPTISATATMSRRRVSVQRGRGWMSPRMRGSSTGRGAAGRLAPVTRTVPVRAAAAPARSRPRRRIRVARRRRWPVRSRTCRSCSPGLPRTNSDLGTSGPRGRRTRTGPRRRSRCSRRARGS